VTTRQERDLIRAVFPWAKEFDEEDLEEFWEELTTVMESNDPNKLLLEINAWKKTAEALSNLEIRNALGVPLPGNYGRVPHPDSYDTPHDAFHDEVPD